MQGISFRENKMSTDDLFVLIFHTVALTTIKTAYPTHTIIIDMVFLYLRNSMQISQVYQ